MTAKILQDYEAIFATDDFIPLKCQLYSELLVKSAEICFKSRSSVPKRKTKHPPSVHQAWKIWTSHTISGKKRGGLEMGHHLSATNKPDQTSRKSEDMLKT